MMYLLAFASSALGCLLIIYSGPLHLRFTADHPGVQPQKFHTELTPRIGGVPIFFGIVIAGLFLPTMPKDDINLYWLLMLSLLPAFLGGFAEDVTRRVGPLARLLLAMITAGFAYSIAGVHFVRSDVRWLDQALVFAPFGYAALMFAVVGVTNAMNIIDGHNGLASGFVGITYMALGYVAGDQGDLLLAKLCYVAGAANAGFFIFNYPRGKIFLGDGGAYLHGCIIALASALLVLRDAHVSPWFPMALVVYPVWETIFSIGRRLQSASWSIADPDALHLHSLVYRRMSRRWVRGRRASDKTLRNSLTSVPFVMTTALLAVAAVMSYNNTRALQALIIGVIALYCAIYWQLSPTRRRPLKQGDAASVPARGSAASVPNPEQSSQ